MRATRFATLAKYAKTIPPPSLPLPLFNFSSSFAGMSATNPLLSLTYPSAPRACALARVTEHESVPSYVHCRARGTIAKDRHSYRVPLECRHSLNPRVSLSATARAIDRPQERLKRFKYALKIDAGGDVRRRGDYKCPALGGFCFRIFIRISHACPRTRPAS